MKIVNQKLQALWKPKLQQIKQVSIALKLVKNLGPVS